MSDLAFNFVCPAGGGDLTGTTYCFDVKKKAPATDPEAAAKPEADQPQREAAAAEQPTVG